MADTKITGLQTPGAFPVVPSTDVLPIVIVADNSMAASGSTRKVTVNQLLGAGGTATLASATISGDLTVDTSTLKVDSANNRVGIGTASPQTTLDSAGTVTISGGTGAARRLNFDASGVYLNYIESAGTAGAGYMVFAAGNSEVYRIATGGTSTWSVGGSTAMTLNSTGLGVGVASPSYQIDTRKDQAAFTTVAIDNQNAIAAGTGTQFLLIDGGVNAGWFRRNRDGSGNTDIGYKDVLRFRGQIAGTERTDMTLDASGNLLVAATSTSLTTGTGFKILQNSGVTTVGTVGSSSSDVDTTYRLYSSTASAYRFYVGYGGTVYATNTTISAISDARLKENVQDIDVGLGAILALKPRKFDWKAGKGKDIKGDRGFIAQEFEQVFPQLVDQWADEAPEGEAPYKSVRQDLIPVLVKAIQELTARVQTLETR